MTDESSAVTPPGARARLVAALERLLESRPTLVQAAGIGLALLGYALPLLFPVAALGLSVHLVGVLAVGGFTALAEDWIALGLLAVSAILTVSLWRLRVGEPGGEPVTDQQVPALFELVDTLRDAFQTPTIHDIHLTDRADLIVQRVPRNGYPVLVRQVLLVGLPALQCLNPEQFKCLLAACLGEMSAVRADVAGWLGQLARTWLQLQSAVAGRWQPAALLYRGFLPVYVPLLTALARRLDSGHRLRRDHYALEVASDDLVVEMFAGEIIMQRFLAELYWPTVYRAAEHSATPNFKVFRNLEPVFHKRASDDLVQSWLREAYVGKWRSDERDPGLRARLHEIGHGELRYRQSAGISAAQLLLGASHQWILDRCDARWAEEHGEEWRARHEKSQRQYERLSLLRDVLQRHGLHGDEAMAYAALVKRYGTAGEALEAYRAILELNPDDAQINFGVGKFLLSCRDPQGVEVLEHAMALDKRYVDPACRLISDFTTEQRTQASRKASAHRPAADGGA
ncbi:MAG TPA: hypothetical protein VIN36_11275 [Thiobacillus sp.]